MIRGKVSEIDPFVEDLLKKQELLAGETSAKIILQTTDQGAQILICAFSEDTVVRVISKQGLSEFILKIIDNI